MSNRAEATRYVERIKNDRKQAYARLYLAYRTGNARHAPEAAGLSYMAAQAVRLNIRALLGEDRTA